jgi:hypothetical protein
MNLKQMFFMLAFFVCGAGRAFLGAHSVQSSALHADDLAIALSEKPEYGELFDLFVDIQVALAGHEPIKVLRPKVYGLIKRIEFVQKYTQDSLLSDVLAWCYAQKGCGKRKLAAWHKALIAYGGLFVATCVASVIACAVLDLLERRRLRQLPWALRQQYPVVDGDGAPGAGVVEAWHQGLRQLDVQIAERRATRMRHEEEVAALDGRLGPLHAVGAFGVNARLAQGQAAMRGPAAAIPSRQYNPQSLDACNIADKPDSIDTQCSICMEEFTSGESCCMDINKTHAYHQSCLCLWLTSSSSSCPVCRAQGFNHYLRFTY